MVYNISLDRGASPIEWCVKVRGGINRVEYFRFAGDVVRFLVSQDIPEEKASKIVVFILDNDIESIQTI